MANTLHYFCGMDWKNVSPRFFKLIAIGFLTILPKIVAADMKPYFYQVSKGERVSYILGTFHEGVSVVELPTYVLERLRESKQLVLETDTLAIPLMGRTRTGPPLSSRLSVEAWEFLKRNLKAYYSENEMERFEDWYAARELFTSFYVPHLKKRKRLDQEIHKLAKAQEKALWFLAPTRAHIANYEESLEDIERLARSPDLKSIKTAFQTRFAIMLEEYKQRLINYEDPENPHPRREQIIVKRNLDWLPQLEGVLSMDKTFVAVGVAHLPGPQGILNLLSQKGFQVQLLGGCNEFLSGISY